MAKIVELPEFLQKTDVEHSLLIGYYGGGNYGDEFLLEVLGNILVEQKTKEVSIAYQNIHNYGMFHHDFGYPLVNMHDKKALIKSAIKHKNIIIGGGGLWGLNFNFNVLLLSCLLFFSKWVLRKKVYLLGVGYYTSTNIWGHLGAFLAAKSAKAILARDEETLQNFRKFNKNTILSRDIATYVSHVNESNYRDDVKELSTRLRITSKTLFFTLRKLEGYYDLIGECISNNTDKNIIAGLLVPQGVRPDGYKLLKSWQKHNPNLQIFDFTFNPLAMFYFFRKNKKQLLVIGPQYHIIVTAHENGVPFMPIVYDNKVRQLLKQIQPEQSLIPVHELSVKQIQAYINEAYKGIK